MSLYELLRNAVERDPEKRAVVCGTYQSSYAVLKARVDNLADNLRRMGVGQEEGGMGQELMGLRQGDRVAMIHENCHVFLETYFAAARLGAVIVPMNYRLSPDDFIYILNHSGAKVLCVQSKFTDWVYDNIRMIPLVESVILCGEKDKGGNWTSQRTGLEVLEEVGVAVFHFEDLVKGSDKTPPENSSVAQLIAESDEDMAQIYYTSGTTGNPKGVILTHGNNLAHAQGTIEELDLTSEDRWLHVSPMFHLADAWAIWSITMIGGTHVIIPSFEPKLMLETIQEHKVTLSNLIPTMLNILVNYHDRNADSAKSMYDLDSMRLIMSGGAPIAREVVRKVIDVFGCQYIQTYGLTETSPFLTMSLLENWMNELPFEERLRYLVTTGRPFHEVQLKVVREDGTEVRKDEEEVGEIIVKGDTITPGYWNDPGITAERIVDGWLHTRDLAVVNAEGYVTIVDRADDMIITGGENVYSVEVEDVLYSHPDVFEAAVVGLPDEVWGERVAAGVVLKDGANTNGGEGGGCGPSEQEIIDFCKERMARFKAPKKVYFLDELPKTGSSKIKKFSLKEMLCRE